MPWIYGNCFLSPHLIIFIPLPLMLKDVCAITTINAASYALTVKAMSPDGRDQRRWCQRHTLFWEACPFASSRSSLLKRPFRVKASITERSAAALATCTHTLHIPSHSNSHSPSLAYLPPQITVLFFLPTFMLDFGDHKWLKTSWEFQS